MKWFKVFVVHACDGYRGIGWETTNNDLDYRLPGVRTRIARIGNPSRGEGMRAVDFEELNSSVDAMTHVLIGVMHGIK
jgi:hypothetical protein